MTATGAEGLTKGVIMPCRLWSQEHPYQECKVQLVLDRLHFLHFMTTNLFQASFTIGLQELLDDDNYILKRFQI